MDEIFYAVAVVRLVELGLSEDEAKMQAKEFYELWYTPRNTFGILQDTGSRFELMGSMANTLCFMNTSI